jgi:CRP-like cAMP-binding protein
LIAVDLSAGIFVSRRSCAASFADRSSGPRLATVVAVEPTKVLALDATALADHLNSHPE